MKAEEILAELVAAASQEPRLKQEHGYQAVPPVSLRLHEAMQEALQWIARNSSPPQGTFKRGVKGVVHSHHKADSEAGYTAEVVLMEQSYPDEELVDVVLLEPYYCHEAGEVIQVSRHTFHPEEQV
jgi:hypothetical protein